MDAPANPSQGREISAPRSWRAMWIWIMGSTMFFGAFGVFVASEPGLRAFGSPASLIATWTLLGLFVGVTAGVIATGRANMKAVFTGRGLVFFLTAVAYTVVAESLLRGHPGWWRIVTAAGYGVLVAIFGRWAFRKPATPAA